MAQKYYKLVIADTTNPAYSKMSAQVAQAIAAGFGYPTDKHLKRVVLADQVLIFNPNDKSVSVDLRSDYGATDAVTAFTADKLVDCLEKPDTNDWDISAGDDIHDATIWDDAITFRSLNSEMVGVVTVPKDFVRKVMSFEPTRGLPVVSFHYPDSISPGCHVLRKVRVTRMDDEYISGFEVCRGAVLNTESNTIKKFKRSKVTSGQIFFLEFIQE